MFRFKLEALLNHRRHQEEICQKALAEARQILSAAQGTLHGLKQDRRQNIEKLKLRQKERCSIPEILILINYIEQLARDIQAQVLKVNRASESVTRKREDLIEIMKKRKTMEKLKEKEWQAYQQDLMQTERKFNDELATVRHLRKT